MSLVKSWDKFVLISWTVASCACPVARIILDTLWVWNNIWTLKKTSWASWTLKKNFLGPNFAFDLLAAVAKSLQSCLTLCDPIDGSPPGSPVPGILQARTLEWIAISFSNAWKWKWSGSVVSNSYWPHGLQPTRLLYPWDFPGKSTGVGCHCLLLELLRYKQIIVHFLICKMRITVLVFSS